MDQDIAPGQRGRVLKQLTGLSPASNNTDAIDLVMKPFRCDEWTDPAANSNTALHAAAPTTVADQVYLAADLIAGGLTALATYARNLSFTTGGTAAHGPSSAVIVGKDIDGNALTETVTLSQSAGTDLGVKAFKTITSITLKNATNTDATVAIGLGKKFGMSRAIKSRAGRLAVIQEVAIGAVVTTGTFVDSTTSPPYGTYAPAAAPDGSNDYAVTFERA